jgi:hypothetical protein
MLLFSRISQNYFYIGKVKDRVYGLRDHGWLSFHGGLMTMGRHGRSGVQEIIIIARRERERGGGRRGSHQLCRLESKLQR